MKKVLIISFLIFTILSSYLNICYAKTTVTESSLNKALNELSKNFNDSIKNIKLNTSTKKIEVSTTNYGVYYVDYNLSNNPTFKHEFLITEKMSYDEFSLTSSLPLIGYFATLVSLGISFEDISLYFVMSAIFSNTNSSTTEYKPENGIIHYINAEFPKEKNIFSDSQGFNTYSYTTEKKVISQDSLKLIQTMTVNLDSDFSKLNGYAPKKPEPLPNEVIIIPPTKTKYEIGEKLDLEGLTITAIYDNNEIKQITKDYTVKGYNKNKQGKQTVTISYKGFSKSFDVQVGKKTYPNADDNNMIYVTETENKTNIEKLPQTGNFSYIKAVLYFISGLLSIALIYLVYKSFKHSKIKK